MVLFVAILPRPNGGVIVIASLLGGRVAELISIAR